MADVFTALRAPDGQDGAPDPWRAGPGGAPGRRPPAPAGHEPALRAPWPALALAAALPALYGLQVLTGAPLAAADRFGFRPGQLAGGGWTGLFTSLFVHAGWMHALFNALAALAFGAPVARRLGTRPAGAAAFLLFFVACGLAGGLGFAALERSREAVLVGASGGIAGLMGAASRMVPPAGARLLPLSSPPVLAIAGAWLAVNAVFAVVGLTIATGGAPLAWQAHVFGYAAGLLLIGPVLRFLRPRG